VAEPIELVNGLVPDARSASTPAGGRRRDGPAKRVRRPRAGQSARSALYSSRSSTGGTHPTEAGS